MRKQKGDKQQSWNWQTAEVEACKGNERMNKSEIIATCPGSSQNGIEMLDSSFSETHSVDNGKAPIEVEIMKIDKQSKEQQNVDILMSKAHRQHRRVNNVRDTRPVPAFLQVR